MKKLNINRKMKEPTVVEVINFLKQALVDRVVLELTEGRIQRDLVSYTDSELDAFLEEHNDELDDIAVQSIIALVNEEPDVKKNGALRLIIDCCRKNDRNDICLGLMSDAFLFSIMTKEVFYHD